MQHSSSNPYLPSLAQRRSDDAVQREIHSSSGGSGNQGSLGLGYPSSPPPTSSSNPSATSPLLHLPPSASKRASYSASVSPAPSPSASPSTYQSGAYSPSTQSPSGLSSHGLGSIARPSFLQQQHQGQGQGSGYGHNDHSLLLSANHYPQRQPSPMNDGNYGFAPPPRPMSRNLSRGSFNGGGVGLVDPFQQRQHGGGESRTQLFVGNLPFRVRWQDLKDLFRKCGTVLRSDVALTLDNRSKGFGTVLFGNEQDAYRAIEMYNGYTWQSRVLDVRLDQQDPTGAVAMANAAAQQAQQHAHQSHQQAMQNMANMIGINAAQAAMAAMQQQGGPLPPQQAMMNQFQQQQQHQHQMGAQSNNGGPPPPWMAAAMAANVNAAAAAAVMQHQQNAMYGPTGNGNNSNNSLSAGMANMNLRRNSSSYGGGVRPGTNDGLAPPSSSNLGQDSSSTPLVSPSISSSSRPGTSTGISSSSTAPSTIPPTTGAASSPPISGQGASPATQSPSHKEAISPTALARRAAPPGTLGALPPSIFANMSSNAHLPNPPAAAAAAKAAGYSLEDEANDVSPRLGQGQGHAPGQSQNGSPFASAGGQGSSSEGARSPDSNVGSSYRKGSGVFQDPMGGPSASGYGHLQQQQHQQGNMAAPNPMLPPGGLLNFYSQNNGSGLLSQQQPSPMSHLGGLVAGGGINNYRNTPSPAYANRHLFVGNIPFNCQWQDLKDLFRAAGQILRADVSLGPDGRSRGFGTVLFATTEDAMNAVQMFNGYEFQGRVLKVHFDKFAIGGGGGGGAGQPGMMQHMGSLQGSGGGGYQSMQYNNSYYGQGSGIGLQPSPNMIYNQLPPPQQPTPLGVHPGFQQSGLSSNFLPGHRHNLSFDDNSSVPGTPIHELSLSNLNMNMANGFPSPGFGSPIPQLPRQSSDQRRAGYNADGVAVAPIGSGAPPHHHEGEENEHSDQIQQQQHYHGQQQNHGHGHHPPPLSPLNIPLRNMGMGLPSPGPNGMFLPMMGGMGPMSPQQGLPMMTPSMPGFSFHPFPQTPPLLPQFLSPGLGPFSPPLMGTSTHFFGGGGPTPSGLRNAAPGTGEGGGGGEHESTPLQSPDLYASNAYRGGNYFPMMMAPQPITGQRHVRGDSQFSQNGFKSASASSEPEVTKQEEATSTQAPEDDEGPGTPKQDTTPTLTPTIVAAEAEDSSASIGLSSNPRRASYLDSETSSGGLVAPTSSALATRGVSLDIPRPMMDMTESVKEDGRSGSAITDEEEEEKKRTNSKENNNATNADANGNGKPAMGVKKGPWNLSWLQSGKSK